MEPARLKSDNGQSQKKKATNWSPVFRASAALSFNAPSHSYYGPNASSLDPCVGSAFLVTSKRTTTKSISLLCGYSRLRTTTKSSITSLRRSKPTYISPKGLWARTALPLQRGGSGAGVPSAYTSAGNAGGGPDEYSGLSPIAKRMLIWIKNNTHSEDGILMTDIARGIKDSGASAQQISSASPSTASSRLPLLMLHPPIARQLISYKTMGTYMRLLMMYVFTRNLPVQGQC